ncbi:hypothetical protein LCL61_28600 [Amycolatopsis coloradensis]|uniref:Uncharacterized protein n=1 Tax=Amycolatopsis coloradensis TaxID=76021 RepID=A0ACD5BJC4_9PSEU
MADAPPHHRHVLGPFTRWYLVPKARRTAHRRGVDQSAPTTIPSTVLAASRFLHWLDSQQPALADLSQSHVDEWFDSGRGHYRYLHPFITWARTHSLIPTVIRAPFPQYPQRLTLLNDDERLHQLRRCLDEEDIPLTVRVAGVLQAGLDVVGGEHRVADGQPIARWTEQVPVEGHGHVGGGGCTNMASAGEPVQESGRPVTQ